MNLDTSKPTEYKESYTSFKKSVVNLDNGIIQENISNNLTLKF